MLFLCIKVKSTCYALWKTMGQHMIWKVDYKMKSMIISIDLEMLDLVIYVKCILMVWNVRSCCMHVYKVVFLKLYYEYVVCKIWLWTKENSFQRALR